MATNPLRIRFLSFDDAEKQSPLFVVLYVKKLEPVPTPAGKRSAAHRLLHQFTIRTLAKLLSLREDQSKSPVVLSCPDALDLADDDEYVQVLFISPDSKQVLADLLLQRTALVDQCLTDPRYERSVRLELLRSVSDVRRAPCFSSPTTVDTARGKVHIAIYHSLAGGRCERNAPVSQSCTEN